MSAQNAAIHHEKYAHLDLLRAACILSVYIHHVSHQGIWGPLGVSAFFMLSGYLLLGGHFLLIESGRSQSVLNFQRNRLLRILPAYFFTIFVCWLAVDVAPWLPVKSSPDVFHSAWPYFVTFSTNLWIDANGGRWPDRYSHLWSLSIEQWFYLALMPVLICIRANRRQVAWLAMALLMIFAWRAQRGVSLQVLYTSFELNIPMILLGGLLRAPVSKSILPRTELMLLAAFCVAVLIFYRIQQAYWMVFLQMFAAAMLFAVFVGNGFVVNSWLKNPFTLHLGKVSYGFYLYHYLIDFPTPAVIVQSIGLTSAYVIMVYKIFHHAAVVVFVMGLATISYHCLEMPFLRLKKWGR